MKVRTFVCAAVALGLVLAIGIPVAAQQPQQRERAPELVEIQKAMRIQDPAVRLKELERIKAAYPSSQYQGTINSALQFTRIELAGTVDEIVKLQSAIILDAQGLDRLSLYYSFSWQLLKHPKAARFDKGRLLEAVLDYCGQGLTMAHDPKFTQSLTPEQLRVMNLNWPNFYLVEAAAYLADNNVPKAATALADHQKNGGAKSGDYAYVQAELDSALGRQKEALAGYLTAAAANYGDAVDKAKSVYLKLYGTLNGFDAKLEAQQRELPFKPGKAKAPAKWSGKTVLAELFTGSECPPCMGVDLAFDALLEAYDTRYLAVLEYHVPIPRPDPMMCPATRKRRSEYGVSSTPTPIFNGVKNESGGGNRAMAEQKFKEFSAAIEADLGQTPPVKLTVRAALQGDLVNVQFTSDKTVAGADYDVVLVQKDEKYRGASGVVFHRMVVRDLATLTGEAVKAGKFAFSIPAVESATAQFLADFEKQNSFTFPVKMYAVDRTKLAVVFFVQDRASKAVLNAAVADVR